MKLYTTLALLGMISFEEVCAIQYRPDPIQSPWSVKVAKPKHTKISDGYYPFEDEMTDYIRSKPKIFGGVHNTDLLLKSAIKKYAVEGKTNGKPNGEFYITKSYAKDLGVLAV